MALIVNLKKKQKTIAHDKGNNYCLKIVLYKNFKDLIDESTNCNLNNLFINQNELKCYFFI